MNKNEQTQRKDLRDCLLDWSDEEIDGFFCILDDLGVSLMIGSPSGFRNLDPLCAAAFIRAKDTVEFWCEEFECTREELSEFEKRGGRLQCSGTTRKGHRCKHTVLGAYYYQRLAAWIKASKAGGYCVFHGGKI